MLMVSFLRKCFGLKSLLFVILFSFSLVSHANFSTRCVTTNVLVTGDTGWNYWSKGEQCFIEGVADWFSHDETDMFEETGGTSSEGSADGEGINGARCGNPIIVASGNKVQDETDYIGKGEFPLSISRVYNNALNHSGVFGSKWLFNLRPSLALINNEICPPPSNGEPQECDLGTDVVEVYANAIDGTRIQFTFDSVNNRWTDKKKDSVNKLVTIGNQWELTTESEFVERYDSYGKILKQTNPSGITHTYTYNSANQISKITHSSGRTLTLAYNLGKISSITDSASNKYLYTYNSNGYLDTVVAPGSPTVAKKYHYEDSRFSGALTGVTINGKRYSTFTYHSNGRGESTSHSGNVDKFTFSSTSNPVTVTNPLGHDRTFNYQTINGSKKLTSVDRASGEYCPAASNQLAYDTEGFTDRKTDWNGNVTDFDYNDKGQLIKKIEAYGTSLAKTSYYSWMAGENKLIKVTSPDLEVNYHYSTAGRIDWIEAKNLSSNGAFGELRRTSYSYANHANGIVKTQIVDGPRIDVSDISTLEYDNKGNLTQVTNPVGHITILSQYDVLGNVGRIVDANGLQTDLLYDAAGKVLRHTIYNSTSTQITQFEYNAMGNVTKTTYPDNNFIRNIYSNAFRLTSTQDKDGHSINYGYNANGNISSKNINELEPVGLPPIGECGGNGNNDLNLLEGDSQALGLGGPIIIIPCLSTGLYDGKRFSQISTYDTLGRLRTVVGDNSQVTTYEYDDNSNIKKIIDAYGRVTSMNYNSLNQLTYSLAPDGGAINYEYDVAGRLFSITDARQLKTQYFYNGFGDKVKTISPDTGTTYYDYNAVGQLTRMERNDSSISTYTYDAVGRQLTANQNGQNKVFHYDGSTYGKGRLNFVTDTSGKTTLHYDKLGNVTQKISEISGAIYNTYYTYDNVNRVTQVTYPSGHKIKYGYNSRGETSYVTYQNGSVTSNVVTQLDSIPFGPIRSMTFGNNVLRTLDYDSSLRLTKIFGTNGVQDLAYLYDKNDNISRITNGRAISNYGYDSVGRLTSSSSGFVNRNYSYDKVGNRQTYSSGLQNETYSYASDSNQLIKVSANNIQNNIIYTSNGNTQNKNGGTFTYNGENRLIRFQKSGSQTDYSHNAFGQRVKKSGNSGITHYIYEGSQLIAEHNSAGAVQKEYVYLGGQVIGVIKSNVLYFVHNDHIGRAERITDINKATVWLANNSDFNRAVTTNTIGDYNLGFPGQYYDAEKDSWYNYFRDYDAKIGRYIQSDPIGLGGGINTYGYAYQNPVMFTDPLGLAPPSRGSALCGALQDLANNPNNQWVQGNGSFSFSALGTEQLPGGQIVFDGVDIQYVQTSYAFSNSGGVVGRQFAGLGSIIGHSYYSLIFGMGLSGSSLSETTTDMRGTLLGNEISLHGDFKNYVDQYCGCGKE